MRGRKENATHEAAAGRDIFPVAIFEKACYNSLQTCGYSSSVERQLPKLHRWVRLPLAAPARRKRHIACDEFLCFTSKLVPRSFCCSSLSAAIRFTGFAAEEQGRQRIVRLSRWYTSEQAVYRLLRLFKVRARSLRCSSSPNRTPCAGLRFGFGSAHFMRSNIYRIAAYRRKRHIACDEFFGALAAIKPPVELGVEKIL